MSARAIEVFTEKTIGLVGSVGSLLYLFLEHKPLVGIIGLVPSLAFVLLGFVRSKKQPQKTEGESELVIDPSRHVVEINAFYTDVSPKTPSRWV